MEQITKPREEQLHRPGGWFSRYQQYISEFVYGGIDGCVTTFAVVSGAAGASLDSSVVIILGFANLIADGFSMSVGSYLSNKSELENFKKHERIEYQEIENDPEEEREEVRQIFRKKGFTGALLEDVVDVITEKKDRWVDTMMKEELSMMRQPKSPLSMAAVTFISFLAIGIIPLLVYLYDYLGGAGVQHLFRSSIVMTSLAFIGIGFLKAAVTRTGTLKSVAETLSLGAAAAVLAYYTGHFLEQLF